MYGFSVVALFSTLIAALYYGLIAAPKYTSISKFTVTVEGGSSAGAMLDGGLGALLTGGSVKNPQEAYIVQEYIESQDLVRHLKEEIDLYNIFDLMRQIFGHHHRLIQQLRNLPNIIIKWCMYVR